MRQRVRLDWPGAVFTAMEVASLYQANAVIAPVPRNIISNSLSAGTESCRSLVAIKCCHRFVA